MDPLKEALRRGRIPLEIEYDLRTGHWYLGAARFHSPGELAEEVKAIAQGLVERHPQDIPDDLRPVAKAIKRPSPTIKRVAVEEALADIDIEL